MKPAAAASRFPDSDKMSGPAANAGVGSETAVQRCDAAVRVCQTNDRLRKLPAANDHVFTRRTLAPRRRFDLVVSSLPISMRTQHNRREVARNLLFKLAGGERDPIELELAAAGGLVCSR
jgi:hypothetical protein